MRKLISLILLIVIFAGVYAALTKIQFGKDKMKVSKHYLKNGVKENRAANIVTAVVVNYRGLDTLGEVTILFIGAIGLGVVLYGFSTSKKKVEPVSLILMNGCRLLFPFILLLGAYIITHGHLTPGGGFQGGAIIASGFLLNYLVCQRKRINEKGINIIESLSGTVFIVIGLIGLFVGGYFLSNFLPKGVFNTLFSSGVIPIIYTAIGFKVGAELSGIIYKLME